MPFLAHLDLVSDKAGSDDAAAVVFYLAKLCLTSTLLVPKDVVIKLSTNLSSGFQDSLMSRCEKMPSDRDEVDELGGDLQSAPPTTLELSEIR